MPHLYHYVGPKEITARLSSSSAGTVVESAEHIRHWIRQTEQKLDRLHHVTVTFVVDESGAIRIAERRSEHVVCAGGGPVRSAGEMTFKVSAGAVRVVSVTNQSTGYCPEPESWPAVQATLDRARIEHPENFTLAFVFRRCLGCGAINIVKNALFECAVCSSRLPVAWNLAIFPGTPIS